MITTPEERTELPIDARPRTPADTNPARSYEPDPFGTRPTGSRRVVLGLALAGVLAAAVTGVVLATRGTDSAAAAAGHAGHGGGGPATGQSRAVMIGADAARRIGVTYAPVVSEPLAGEVRTVGLVKYDETRVTAIAPKLEGWIERLYVNITGAPVRRGEPLFAIYSPMLVTAQEELLLARRLAREVAAGTPDAARGATDLVESARRRLAYWDVPADEIAEIERSGQVRKTLTLRAPSNGVVVEKNVLQGQRIMAGDAVYRIADLSVVWLEGEVFERDLASIRVGQMVTAELEALPGIARRGRITYLYPTLNTETRTARVRVELSNRDGVLKPGMYATIRVATPRTAPAVTVPRSAVLATGTRTLLFLKDRSGSLVPRDVVVGRTAGERLEIVRGVVPGDTVVASATFLVDAESNLGTALGGMGDMPGMEITTPPTAAPPAAPRPAAPASGMPGMPSMSAPGTLEARPARPTPAAPARPSGGATEGHGGHTANTGHGG